MTEECSREKEDCTNEQQSLQVVSSFLELQHPSVNVNPGLFAPAPLTYFYDYYSNFPSCENIFVPRHSINSPCLYCQSNYSFNCEDVQLSMMQNPPFPSVNFLENNRSDYVVASALLDLSTPGIY